MSEKFVILYDDYGCVGIFDTRADAEEYVFSLVEEAAYEDFLEYIMLPCNMWVRDEPEEWMTAEDYFNAWNLEDIWVKDGDGYRKVPRQTICSAILSYFAEGYGMMKAYYFVS